LFTTGDRATAEEILSADFVLHLADGDVDGRDAFQEFLSKHGPGWCCCWLESERVVARLALRIVVHEAESPENPCGRLAS
jgi:hypothetical protein